MSWDTSVPGDGDVAGVYPALSRSDKTYLETVLALEHDFPGSAGDGSDCFHTVCSSRVRTTTKDLAPITPPEGHFLFTSDEKYFYRAIAAAFAGTVSVVNGSPAITGAGTSWLSTVAAGDIFKRNGDVVSYKVLSVDADDTITLTTNYAGVTGVTLAYTMWSFMAQGINALTPLSSFRRLKIVNNPTHLDHKLDVTIDQINFDGVVIVNSFAETIDIDAAVGINALDVGSKAASTWYYIFAIYNPTSGLSKGLLSLSAASPTMPAGYTRKILLGAVRNDATAPSGNFVSFQQNDLEVLYDSGILHSSPGPIADSNWHVRDISVQVPPISEMVYISLLGAAGANSSSVSGKTGCTQLVVTNSDERVFGLITCPGQNIYYNGYSSGAALYIYVNGYRLTKNVG